MLQFLSLSCALLAVAVGAGVWLHGTPQVLVSLGMGAVSLGAAGLARRRGAHKPPPAWALWFLFLFNLAVAVAVGAGLGAHGAQRIFISIVMGAVSLAAGLTIVRGRHSGTPRIMQSTQRESR